MFDVLMIDDRNWIHATSHGNSMRNYPQAHNNSRGFLRDEPIVSWKQKFYFGESWRDLWRKPPTRPLPQNSNSKEQTAIVGILWSATACRRLVAGHSDKKHPERCRFDKATAGRRTPNVMPNGHLLQEISQPVLQSLSVAPEASSLSRLPCCNDQRKT